MIEPNELRRGNLVTANSPIMVVQAINKHEVELYMPESESDNWTYEFEQLEPIQLSPEILAKCGFKERPHCRDWYINLPNTDTILLYRRKQVGICAVNSSPCLYINCECLHSLMNLYFALTQTELTFNNK